MPEGVNAGRAAGAAEQRVRHRARRRSGQARRARSSASATWASSSKTDIDAAVDALGVALGRLGYKKPPRSALGAATWRASWSPTASPRTASTSCAQGADVDVRLGLTPEELIAAIPDYEALVVRSETKVTAEVLDAGAQPAWSSDAPASASTTSTSTRRRGAASSWSTRRTAITIADGGAHDRPDAGAGAPHPGGARLAAATASGSARSSSASSCAARRWASSGLGRVGSEVARRARGLEMRVIALRPVRRAGARPVAGRAARATKDELLAESDFITLHAPLTAGSHHILGDAEFAQMKPDVRIINVARGELDRRGRRCSRRWTAAASPAPRSTCSSRSRRDLDSPLLHHPNVIVTPHLGASTAEAQERVASTWRSRCWPCCGASRRSTPSTCRSSPPRRSRSIAPYLQAATQAGSLATQLVDGPVRERRDRVPGRDRRPRHDAAEAPP